MPKTPRLGMIYPQENQKPWFDLFTSFANSIDAALYASREDRNYILEGGGVVSWSAGVLSWTESIYLASPYTGYRLELPTSESPVTINAGQFLYVLVTRAAGAVVTLEAKVSSVLPSSNDALLLAVRRGDVLYFRNGRGYNNGDSGPLYVVGGGAGIAGWSRHQISIGTNGDTWIDELGSAASQAALTGTGFTSALLAPGSVDVFYNTALCHYTAGVPSSINQWTWVITLSPSPVVRVGAGSLAGDIVTVKYPI